jgi:hypothetical protein
MEIVHSEYVSPCSPRVLKRWGHHVKQDVGGKHEMAFRRESLAVQGVEELAAKVVARRASLAMGEGIGSVEELLYSLDRYGSSDGFSVDEEEEESVGVDRSKFDGLFAAFPRTLIIVGDAERLVKEVKSLQTAMEKDGVDVQAEWVRDAVHDVLMINQWWWDWGAVEEAWKVVGDWAAGPSSR